MNLTRLNNIQHPIFTGLKINNQAACKIKEMELEPARELLAKLDEIDRFSDEKGMDVGIKANGDILELGVVDKQGREMEKYINRTYAWNTFVKNPDETIASLKDFCAKAALKFSSRSEIEKEVTRFVDENATLGIIKNG